MHWATELRTAQPAEWSRRLSLIRGFARYRSGTDPRTQIPATGLLPYRPQRASPYLYSDVGNRAVAAGRRAAAFSHGTACPDLCGRFRITGGHRHARRGTGRAR